MPPTWLGLYKDKINSLFILQTNQPPLLQPPFFPPKSPLLLSKKMEFSTFHPSTWNSFFTSPLLFPYQFIPENYVHWRETPESHIYSADLPGVKKEEIKVEVEDSSYLIIRTEAANETTEPIRSFMRKFRLPGMVDMDGISASYRDGVLTVTVPRTLVRRGFFIEPDDLPESIVNLGASAA